MSSSAERFDVLIVGARCAGAPLAHHLAEAGLSVAALDAGPLPGDQPTSTHLIQPPGMEELDALGLGEEVRRATPGIHAMRLSFDRIEARLSYGRGRTAHCLPREVLDGLLQRAAIEAGADLRPQVRVTGLLRDPAGRVRGVLASEAGEEPRPIEAELVVGADGRNSTIAKLVGAEEYLAYDGPRSIYWAYWPTPRGWDVGEFHSSFAGASTRGIFPTTDDRLLIATVPLIGEARSWRREHTAAYIADIRTYRPVSEALAGSEPMGSIRGVYRPRYFFRVSAGPGWALIGDAGHHKEFVTGLGISDALRDARALAGAILESGPDSPAVRDWWRTRDIERLALYDWGRELGRAEPVDAMQRLIASRLARWPGIDGRFGELITGRLDPDQLIPPFTVLRWMAGATLRGDLSVLPSFLTTVRRGIRERHRLSQAFA